MQNCKKLYLLRHATAEPEIPCQLDFGRCLTKKGKKELQHIRQYFDHHENINPKIILCSKAKRCQQTLRAIRHCFEESQIVLHHFLYLSSVYTLLDILCLIEDKNDAVLIVGHQKTISEVLDLLIQDDQKRQIMFPKGCACGSFIGFNFDDTASWSEISFHPPILQNIFYP